MAVSHDLPLLSTIAVGMSLAFVLGLTAVKLRVPPIVGYLLAGVIMGPYTPGFDADLQMAEQLSEIGIVLLMFGVGLHAFPVELSIAPEKLPSSANEIVFRVRALDDASIENDADSRFIGPSVR